MALRGTPRLVAACAGIATAIAVLALARHSVRSGRIDPAREVFLETRRERIRAARSELLASRNGEPA
jgi:hypothetical protein